MIKRDRPFGSEPGVLQSDSATNEQKRASDYYAKEPCGFPAFDAFRVYRDVEVKKALRTIFEKKCAYCESKFVNQGVQVEHFRPKGGVQLTRDPASTIGYWWLASEWTNLLPACSDCNTVTKHFLPDGSVKKLGKGNYFPLLPGQGCAPSRGFLHLEVPLLVDPTYDDPRRYLEFTVGSFGGRTRSFVRPAELDRIGLLKAEATIEGFGLNRRRLVAARTAILASLERELFSWRRLVMSADKMASEDDKNVTLQQAKTMLNDILNNFAKRNKPYSAACFAFAKEWLARNRRGTVPRQINSDVDDEDEDDNEIVI